MDTDIQMRVYRRATADIEGVTFSQTIGILRGYFRLYYPYWIVRYHYRKCDYFAVFDGVLGHPISGRGLGKTDLSDDSCGFWFRIRRAVCRIRYSVCCSGS
ncbi:MAG: hypothetical protein LBU24_05460 [Methanocalculaceae archaeon]|nr:hypothetical protein [Methanocalculaceae archaeon]